MARHSRRALTKEDAIDWGEKLSLKPTAQLQLGGKVNKDQGEELYMQKCQELGVVPSTQVRAPGCGLLSLWCRRRMKSDAWGGGGGWAWQATLLLIARAQLEGVGTMNTHNHTHTYTHTRTWALAPRPQVMQQLRLVECNLAHCKLGHRGAQALRHALLSNTCITDLNLLNNGLDSQAGLHGLDFIQ